jgi:hypothetical protein
MKAPIFLLFLSAAFIKANPSNKFQLNSKKLQRAVEQHKKLYPDVVIGSKNKIDMRESGTNDPTPLMIAKMGYPAETHEVITEDGYILQMHRIPFEGLEIVKRRSGWSISYLLGSMFGTCPGPEIQVGWSASVLAWGDCIYRETSVDR